MAQPDLITLTDPHSPASEAYRTLRTNLLFSGLKEPLHTLVITSPAAEAGKSITLANLAVTLAQSGRKTIIVDCDLRRPTQHTIWGVPQESGLSATMLEGSKKLPYSTTDLENLRLLCSGPLPPNPADLIGSPRMDAVIQQLKKDADIVLFDAPPLLAVTDATLLAAKLDGVLLVVRSGATRRDHAERAKELLNRVNVRLVGAVLTDAVVDSKLGQYYAE